MTIYVRDILADALSLVGVGGDEAPTPSELQLALRTANIMLGSWSSSRLLMRSTTPLDFTATVGQAVYTIAPSGADIIGAVPLSVSSAYYRDSGTIDTPIEIVSVEFYNNLPDKQTSTGPFEYVAYDPGATQQTSQKGTFYFYMNPDSQYDVHLEVDSYITEFTTLTDAVRFDPVYYEALVYGLAARLFRHFHAASSQLPADIQLIAAHSLDKLRALNASIPSVAVDLPGKAGGYNIYVDGPSR